MHFTCKSSIMEESIAQLAGVMALSAQFAESATQDEKSPNKRRRLDSPQRLDLDGSLPWT